jgi:hypothetical protein
VKDIITITNRFSILGVPVKASPLGSGHINDSFRITTVPEQAGSAAPEYVLQRINREVFSNIPGLMDNIIRVTDHMRDQLSRIRHDPGTPSSGAASFASRMQVLQLVPGKDGSFLHRDPDGNFWRMYGYISGSHSYDRVPGPELAGEGGRAFGTFLQLTTGLDHGSLCITIPRFHDITWRLEQFDDALEQDIADRRSLIRDETGFVKERADEMHTIHRLLAGGRLPVRVTHNDTKFNNILFDGQNRAICIVDLDTVMPGTVLYDFGDAIRTGASTTDEDEPDLNRVGLNMRLFEAYAKGFLETAGPSLTTIELENLAFSAKFMTYLIGLRFLTDYLNGDIYYKIRNPGHNLQRARVQFILLKSMESHFAEMKARVSGGLARLLTT